MHPKGWQISGLSDSATVNVPSGAACAVRSQELERGSAEIAAAILNRSRRCRAYPTPRKTNSCAVLVRGDRALPRHFQVSSAWTLHDPCLLGRCCAGSRFQWTLFLLVSNDLAAFRGPASADLHTRPDRRLIGPGAVLLKG